MPYDVVIRNGKVVNGSGSAPYRADIALRDSRIAEIGRVTDRAAEVIDAGEHLSRDGDHTGALPGQLLRAGHNTEGQ